MRYFLLTSLIMSFCAICLAKEQHIIGYYEKSGQKKALTLSETIDVITKKEDLKNLTISPMSSPLSKEKGSISKEYAKTLVTAIKKIVPKNANDDLIANEKVCNKLIQLRNKLLEAGGYSNICLAGSITGTINTFYLQTLLNGNTIKLQMIKKNKLNLKNIINIIEAADKTEFKTSILSKINKKPGTAIEKLRLLFGDGNTPKKGPVNYGNWLVLAKKVSISFNGDSLNKPDSISYLCNWSYLLDEQKAIEIINKIALKDSKFLFSDDTTMKEKIQKYLQENDCGIMFSKLKPWSENESFNFFRKFKATTLRKYDSPYSERLFFFLDYHESQSN